MTETLLGLAFICFIFALLGALADYLQANEKELRNRYGDSD